MPWSSSDKSLLSQDWFLVKLNGWGIISTVEPSPRCQPVWYGHLVNTAGSPRYYNRVNLLLRPGHLIITAGSTRYYRQINSSLQPSQLLITAGLTLYYGRVTSLLPPGQLVITTESTRYYRRVTSLLQPSQPVITTESTRYYNRVNSLLQPSQLVITAGSPVITSLCGVLWSWCIEVVNLFFVLLSWCDVVTLLRGLVSLLYGSIFTWCGFLASLSIPSSSTQAYSQSRAGYTGF